MTAFYLAGFEKQLTGSALGGKNCSMASAAMLADQSTLGVKNPTPDSLRKISGDTDGGLTIAQVGSVLGAIGVHTTVYDASDGFTFDRLVAELRKGRFAVVNGDYDQVPMSLRGDKTFTGLHSEFWQRVAGSGIVVGDPLNDGRRAGIPKGYVTYTMDVARNYVEKYDRQVPGTGIHVALMDLRRVKSRAGRVNVRSAPEIAAGNVLGLLSGTSTLAWGASVRGQSVAGNNLWYRVWYPARSRIAFVHSSVVVTV